MLAYASGGEDGSIKVWDSAVSGGWSNGLENARRSSAVASSGYSSADVCSRMTCALLLTYAGVPLARSRMRSSSKLTYADVCWRMLAYAGICWRMLAFLLRALACTAPVCWRMLTYADVC